MYSAILLAVLLVVGVASPFIFKKNDTPVEETIERILEKKLDLPENSLDFSDDEDK